MKHTPTNVCIDPPGFTPMTLHFMRHTTAPVEITQTPAWGDYWGIRYHDAIVGTTHAHAENERGNAVRALFTTPAQAKATLLRVLPDARITIVSPDSNRRRRVNAAIDALDQITADDIRLLDDETMMSLHSRIAARAMYLSDEIRRRQWSRVAAAGLTATTDTQWPDALEEQAA